VESVSKAQTSFRPATFTLLQKRAVFPAFHRPRLP